NIQMVGLSGEEFVLIDAGMPKSVSTIMKAVEERFGENSRPKAIVLTHGHFDHVGALIELIEHWDVPVYAHPLEIPYITGEKSYPKPDASVEGGLVAKMSPMIPNDPIDIGENAYVLPDNGSVPALQEFKWIHTPSHSPGHVSLFRVIYIELFDAYAFVTVSLTDIYHITTL